MKAILHIFAKDTRRFWPEISISLAVTAAFVCLAPNLWITGSSPMLEFLAGLMVALLPASWWVLIARVIHEERLIGDTQFWITRPYEWKKLLAAKLLFLAAFIYLPFLIAESLLLAEAGFNPLVSLPGLLLKSLLFVSFFVLSLSALAAVTSNFARMTLTMLGALVGITVFFVVLFLLFGARGNEIHNVFGSQLCLALFVLVCGAAIVLQYALRKAWLARLVLITLPILIVAVTAVSPDQLLMDHRYPVSAVQAADAQIGALLQLAYSPETPHQRGIIQNMGAKVQIGVIVPLEESGVAEGSMVSLNALRAEFTAPDGTRWNSAWQSAGEVRLLAGENHPNASIMMPIEFYRKFQSMPLSVHLTFAITQARAGQPITLPLSAGDFTVADFGLCSPQRGQLENSGNILGIKCLSALRQPPLTLVKTHWADAPCSASPDSGLEGDGWAGALDSEPGFGILSVEEVPVGLPKGGGGNYDGPYRHLCPGTPITFTRYSPVRRTQTSVNIQNFHLAKMTEAGGQITVE